MRGVREQQLTLAKSKIRKFRSGESRWRSTAGESIRERGKKEREEWIWTFKLVKDWERWAASGWTERPIWPKKNADVSESYATMSTFETVVYGKIKKSEGQFCKLADRGRFGNNWSFGRDLEFLIFKKGWI